MPKPQMSDPQGEAVRTALSQLGFTGIESMRIGKSFNVTLTAKDQNEADELVGGMCEKLLFNPVTEVFEFEFQGRQG